MIRFGLMNRFNDRYNFRIITGLKESVTAIKEKLETEDSNLRFEIVEITEGAYAQMRITGYPNDEDSEFYESKEELITIVEEIKANHPNVDVCFLNQHWDRYSGADSKIVCRSLPNSTKASAYEIEWFDDFSMFDGIDGVPLYITLYSDEKVSCKEITIELKDSQKFTFIPRKNLNLMEKIKNLKSGKLTMGFLAELCCTKTVKKQKIEFITDFAEKISSVSNIKRVYIKETISSRGEMLYEASLRLKDPSAALMFESYSINTVEQVFDFELNTLHYFEKNQIHTYNGTDYEIMDLDEKTYDEAIPGANDSGDAIFLFDTKNKTAKCMVCLSDAEIIEIPSIDPASRKTVVTIDADCFKNCRNIKKILIPKSITNLSNTYFSKTRRKIELVRMEDV